MVTWLVRKKVIYVGIVLLTTLILTTLIFTTLPHLGSAQNQTATYNNTNWTGSVQMASKISQLVRSQTHVPLTDATTTAMHVVGANSSANSATLVVLRGYLVYDVLVTDSNNILHRVIVDAGNGNTLSNAVVSLNVQTPFNLMAKKTTLPQRTNNTTPARLGEIIKCFESPCNPPATATGVPALAIGTANKNTTAFIGVSINNTSLQDLAKHKDQLKGSLSKYINSTIDSLAGGHALTHTNCFIFPAAYSTNTPAAPIGPHRDKCHIITGIGIGIPIP